MTIGEPGDGTSYKGRRKTRHYSILRILTMFSPFFGSGRILQFGTLGTSETEGPTDTGRRGLAPSHEGVSPMLMAGLFAKSSPQKMVSIAQPTQRSSRAPIPGPLGQLGIVEGNHPVQLPSALIVACYKLEKNTMIKKTHRPVNDYSDAELERLREQFLEWASVLMKRKGRFCKSDAVDDGWGRALTEHLITVLNREGMVRDVGQTGYRVADANIETVPLDIMPEHYTKAERDYIQGRVLKVAREETRLRGRFSERNIVDQVGCSYTVARFFMDELEEKGEIETLGHNGRVACGVEWDPTQPNARRLGAGRISEARQEWVYELFVDWANATSRRQNRFSRPQAIEAGFSQAIIDELLEMGLAREDLCEVRSVSGGVSLYRSDQIDGAVISQDKRPGGRGTAVSVEELQALREEVAGWVKEHVSFSGRDIRKHFGVSKRAVRWVLESFLESGLIVESGWPNRYVRKGAVRECASLEELVRAAVEAKDPAASSRKPGRRANGEALNLDVLTTSQVKMVRTVARDVAEELYGDRSATKKVSLAHPLFERSGDGWKLESAVRRWSEERGRSENTTSRYVSAATLMMELAVDRGVVDPEYRPSDVQVAAAEWKEVADRWRERVVEANEGQNASGLKAGVGMLARTASRRGELSPEDTNWAAVRERLRQEGRAGRLPSTWKRARQAYCILRDIGEIEGPVWSYGRSRKALFAVPATERAALENDWSGITDREGNKLGELVEGPYGLKAYRLWATLDEWELEERGLPPRSYVDPTTAQEIEEEKFGSDLFRLSVSESLPKRIYSFGYLLGWVERSQDDIDLLELTVVDLLQPSWLKEMAMEMRGLDESSQWDRRVPSMVHSLASSLAVLGTFLEGQMRQRNDDEQADEVREAAALLRKFRRGMEIVRHKDIEAIASAYRGSDKVPGWIKLNRLCDLVLNDVEKIAGLPLDEQVQRLMIMNGHSYEGTRIVEGWDADGGAGNADGPGAPGEGGAWRSYGWAKLIRSAMLINFVRLVPVRRKALSGIKLDMWNSFPGTGNPGNWPRGPWAGEIQIELPSRLAKSNRDFDVAYLPAKGVGVDRYEEGARRRLLYLWFAPNGAREILLTTQDGQVVDSPFVFPASARSVEGMNPSRLEESECQWAREKLSYHYGQLIREYGPSLEIDVARAEGLYGALAIHAVRALFGTYWVGEKGHLQLATDMLEHADVDTTKKRYCANGPTTSLREVPEEEFG